MKFVSKKGITRTGNKTNIFDPALCNRIRKRLGVSEKELSNRMIRDVIRESNTMIGDFIADNPDGYRLEVGFDKQKPMGFLVVSKHLPKEFRDTKEEKVEKISKIELPELYRQQLLKRYNVDVGRVIDYAKLNELGILFPHLNLQTYFFRFKTMWFNRRNCKSKKARAYEFVVSRRVNKKVMDNVWSGKEYYEYNFNDFYGHKIKSKF